MRTLDYKDIVTAIGRNGEMKQTGISIVSTRTMEDRNILQLIPENIKGAGRALIEIPESSLYDVIDELLNHIPVGMVISLAQAKGYFGLWYSLEDITGLCKSEYGTEISTGQAQEVAQYLESTGDCEYGITWDTIRTAIEDQLNLTRQSDETN